jgi:hypothetical protein
MTRITILIAMKRLTTVRCQRGVSAIAGTRTSQAARMYRRSHRGSPGARA